MNDSVYWIVYLSLIPKVVSAVEYVLDVNGFDDLLS